MMPYSENLVDSKYIRKFSEDISSEDLVWHRDREDRSITVISSSNWMFQFEDGLPFLLKEGESFFVKKGQFHRIIKGKGDLLISVDKINRSERSIRVEKILSIINKSK